jgi:hypothetical protein
MALQQCALSLARTGGHCREDAQSALPSKQLCSGTATTNASNGSTILVTQARRSVYLETIMKV